MRNECNIICDLLPLYAENMVSEDSAAFIKEHLENCEKCHTELDQIRKPNEIKPQINVEPIKKLKRKMRLNKLKTVIFTAVIVLVVAVSVFAILDAPQYYPYSEELITLTENADGSVLIKFSQEITDYRCYTTAYEPDSGKMIYNIEAWSSFLKKQQGQSNALSFTLVPPDDEPLIIHYVQNNGQEDVCLTGEEHIGYAGVITLPRLTLGYYVIIASALFVIMLIAWLLFKRNESVRRIIEKLLLLSISYIFGHFIVTGFSSESYSIIRDLGFIVLISLLIYCGALLILSVFRTRRELKRL